MTTTHTIEHVVLFKLKDTTETSDAAHKMVSRINGLISLDQVLHITAVPLRLVRSTSGQSFTLILHSRFLSKPDLASYAVDPTHLNVIKENAPLVDDVLAVDWVAVDLLSPAAPPPGSALRVAFLKLKEDLGKERKSEILEAIRGIKDELGGKVIQFSYGENFSPERSKGFSIAFLAVFPSLREMESADSKQEEERLKDSLDNFIVVDYVVPPP